MFKSNLVKLKFNAFKINEVKLKIINFLTFFLTFNVLTIYYLILIIVLPRKNSFVKIDKNFNRSENNYVGSYKIITGHTSMMRLL